MRADKLFLIVFCICFCSCNESEKANAEGNEIEQSETEEKPSSEITEQLVDTSNKVEIVKQIELLSNNIEKELPRYDTVQRIVFGYSSEGSELIGYYDKEKNIKKIVVQHAGEHGKSTEQYYFNNGILILVHRRTSVYEKPIFESGNIQEAAFIDEHCYFNNDILLMWTSQFKKIKESSTTGLLQDDIKQTDENSEVIRSDNNYEKQAQALIKYAKEYKSKLSEK